MNLLATVFEMDLERNRIRLGRQVDFDGTNWPREGEADDVRGGTARVIDEMDQGALSIRGDGKAGL